MLQSDQQLIQLKRGHRNAGYTPGPSGLIPRVLQSSGLNTSAENKYEAPNLLLIVLCSL